MQEEWLTKNWQISLKLTSFWYQFDKFGQLGGGEWGKLNEKERSVKRSTNGKLPEELWSGKVEEAGDDERKKMWRRGLTSATVRRDKNRIRQLRGRSFSKGGRYVRCAGFQNIRQNRKLQGNSRMSFLECSLSFFCDYKNPCAVNPLQRIPSRKARTHHLIHSLSLPPSRDF